MLLENFFRANPRFALAFSGGADSSYLLHAAKTAGCNVHAYFVASQFQPRFELEAAKTFANQYGITLTVCRLDALAVPEIAGNPPDRCYHCKKTLITRLWELARADGFYVLCDGTNADDNEADRPGMAALRELDVTSPLRLCGLTKAEIRRLSKEAGLPNKPAYSCLATRIPSYTALTNELLLLIEHAETRLFEIGFTDFRVRLLPPRTAKLQIPEKELPLAIERREMLFAALDGFDELLLDLKGRNTL